jgi:phosphopantothenoylcysteine decarboxylase/phosphopantothenate--cysteine ligase
MPDRPGREIALGVGAGIAAYKIPELVRLLVRSGVGVTVLLTRNAEQFVTPLTLQTLSGRAVVRDLYDLSAGGDVEHVALTRRIDLLLVAPATAAVLARFAHGLALDFLSTFFLAARCPVLVAPSMNTRMLHHPATQANLALLRERGVRILDPESGELACGEEGEGRLPDPERIASVVRRSLERRAFWERHTVLVTAGPTREHLDPVRVVTNPSTGRMGYATAEEAVIRGARVILVTGPTDRPVPAGAEVVRVVSTEQMRRAVLEALPRATIMIKAAAPSDLRPSRPSDSKSPKSELPDSIPVEPTSDILSEVGRRKGDRFLVGFAAETTGLVDRGRRKLQEKNLDLVVANEVGRSDTGFGSDTDRAVFLGRDGSVEELPLMTKRELAARLLDRIERTLGSEP